MPAIHQIRRGLDLPIAGAPSADVEDGPYVRRVAVLGDDFVGMKPTMVVQVGEQVKLGQVVFYDKKTPGVQHTSPGAGTVVEINRGAKRHFISLVIELDGADEVTFDQYDEAALQRLSAEKARQNLINSGLWTALRTRPFSKVPSVDSAPHSIFVTAMDSSPLAASPELLLRDKHGDFERGIRVLTLLSDGTVFVCTRPGVELTGVDQPRVQVEQFAGPHPAGLPGTHIHTLDPVDQNKTVWQINYQDVIAIGQLFLTGRLPVERVVSLAGPMVNKPRLLRTRMGANIEDLVQGQLVTGPSRIVSGSVLAGRQATGNQAYLGRYHWQISAISNQTDRVFLEFLRPGDNRFSIKHAYLSALRRVTNYPFTTSQEGSCRPIVPVGAYEKVMPLDILPTYLLRALSVGDTQQAQALGCLELDEEDLSLCAFVCPGKNEYGRMLRECLTRIEQEG